MIRTDWTLDEIQTIYNLSFPELIYRAMTVHRQFHDPQKMQLCTLLNIKTGGCPEDCKYCSQSVHYDTGLEKEKLLDIQNVMECAKKAQANGSVRFCMGAAWREVKNGVDFEKVLNMVRAVHALGMEVCVTLGMLTQEQALRLKDAGLTAYNHNLDTSREFYPEIITTRTYDDRLQTLQNVRQAGISVCSGGIIGMGESIIDRLKLILEYAGMNPHPESVPINMLVKIPNTPLAKAEPLTSVELIRLIALTRIVLPKSIVRLSAGRTEISDETQMLCFLAGANSIFTGEKLLTTPNPGQDQDQSLLERLGMRPISQETHY